MNFGFSTLESKKAGTEGMVPALSWLVARINLLRAAAGVRPADSRGQLSPHKSLCYAVLRGRTVKSRNWVRTLDICIPLSCDTNGRISAMN